jgi:hypothetical protein
MGGNRWAESKCRRPDTAIKREKCGYFLLAAFACAYAVSLAAGFALLASACNAKLARSRGFKAAHHRIDQFHSQEFG